jgi:hypothetical protein
MPQLTALRRVPFQQNCQRISHSVYKTSLLCCTESAEQNCTWRSTGTATVHMERQTERIDCWAFRKLKFGNSKEIYNKRDTLEQNAPLSSIDRDYYAK